LLRGQAGEAADRAGIPRPTLSKADYEKAANAIFKKAQEHAKYGEINSTLTVEGQAGEAADRAGVPGPTFSEAERKAMYETAAGTAPVKV
jgi:hypothetical protein